MLLDKIGRFFIKKYNKNIIKFACVEKAGQFAFENNEFIIINNGIDIDKFKFDENSRNELRKEWNISDDTIVLGNVAMFHNQKNHKFLIEIFEEYLKLNEKAKLILVGEGVLLEETKELVHKKNLDSYILFLGKRMDANKIYSAMDCYVMPSLYEGLSISLCEAQINGLQCYTSDRVDQKSNIVGNVKFLPLEYKPLVWANEILNGETKRDLDVLNRIPEGFDSKKSYKKVEDFYKNNK